MFQERVDQVECLLGYEGNDFASTGNVEEDLLSTTAVYPMRRDAVDLFLRKAGADWSLVEGMLKRGLLAETVYKDKTFYLRGIKK